MQKQIGPKRGYIDVYILYIVYICKHLSRSMYLEGIEEI